MGRFCEPWVGYETLFWDEIIFSKNFFCWRWLTFCVTTCLVKIFCYLEDIYDLNTFQIDLVTPTKEG